MPSGPERAFFIWLYKLFSKYAVSFFLVILRPKYTYNSFGKRRQFRSEQPTLAENLISARMCYQVGQLQAGHVIRLWLDLELSTRKNGLKSVAFNICCALFPEPLE